MGAGAVLLAGCLGDGAGVVSRAATPDQAAKPVLGMASGTAPEDAPAQLPGSDLVETLAARRSALPPGGPFDAVARAVLAANARTAESALRAARLREQAASKNWLPQIGPEISLTSLSRVIASLVIEAAVFDHGRLKAERAFAKADVEVAAVTLAEDSNERVLTALRLYLAAQEGRETAALHAATLERMGRFEYIISERVRGDVSDMSDLNVIRQKLAEIRAARLRSEEAAGRALAELGAMAAQPLGAVSGISAVEPRAVGAVPLAVLRAQAERDRAVAQAAVARADNLPGLVASVRLGDASGGALSTDGRVGLGTGAALRAIEAARETAAWQVRQSAEDSDRLVRRLESDIASRARQAREAAALSRAAQVNLDLFQQQFDAGQRQVLDVVQVYEIFARQQEAEIGLKYEASLARLELARALGVLADGEAI